ncbi:MAG: hypothetical protein RIR70_13 [Pseudomonadota bacterium]
MTTLPASSLPRRFASILYESLLLLGVLALTFMVPQLVLGVVWQKQLPGVVSWLYLYLVLGAYFMWFWLHGGQTLAMQTWKIRLADARTGEHVSQRQALLRYTLAWGSVLFFGCGLIWAFFDRDQQFLHDRLSGTRLVFEPTSTVR